MVPHALRPSRPEAVVPTLLLSELLGKPVRGRVGEVIGVLRDLVVDIETAPYPVVKGIVANIGSARGHPFFIRQSDVAGMSIDEVLLATSAVNLQPFERRDGEALLAKDVLDKQIIDISGRRVVRANDIQLAKHEDNWRVVAVDVSMVGFAARVVPRRWVEGHWQRQLLPWEGIEFFAADVPGVRIAIPHDKLRTLHPADLAVLLRELSYEQGSEALASLDEEAAADAVKGLEPPLQAALLSKMGPERAADILEEMDPDDAADLVGELPEEQAGALVSAMVPEAAADVQMLMAYQEGTAGSIMTTDIVTLPADLLAEAALARLRRDSDLPEVIYTLYLVDPTDGPLVGVLSLRDLIVADPKVQLQELMEKNLITAQADDSAEEVAHLIAHYDLVALPILDDAGCPLGLVTVDDALDVLLPAEWKRQLPRVFR